MLPIEDDVSFTPTNFPGIYRGVVVSHSDPEKRNRLLVKVPQLMGHEVLEWALPCVPPGFYKGVVKNHNDHVFTDNADTNSTETLVHTSTNIKGQKVPEHVLVQPYPKAGSGVWVMFEGGSLEHPVWMGTWL